MSRFAVSARILEHQTYASGWKVDVCNSTRDGTVRRPLFRCLLAGVCFARVGLCARDVRGQVEGDATLLELLRAAQLTNMAQYPSGELHATVKSQWDGATVDVTATVVWKGEATYWDYELSRTSSDNSSHEKCQLIDDGRTLISYWPETRFLQRISDRMMGRAEQLSLRPDQIWYRIEGIANWAKLLDPSEVSKGAGGDAARIVVTRLDEDKVQVERRRASGTTLRIVASLAENGNVIEYEGIPGKTGGIWRKGSYVWSKSADGRSFLKEYDYVRALSGNRRKPDRVFHLSVDSFRPDAPIAPDRFQMSSLNVPADAIVEDVSAAGSRRYGRSRPTLVDENSLLELARKLRQEGFAIPAETER